MILGSALAGPLYAAVRSGELTAAAVLSGAILVAWLAPSRRRLVSQTEDDVLRRTAHADRFAVSLRASSR
jgi:hypothetical protein